jgi:hypothetical protein
VIARVETFRIAILVSCKSASNGALATLRSAAGVVLSKIDSVTHAAVLICRGHCVVGLTIIVAKGAREAMQAVRLHHGDDFCMFHGTKAAEVRKAIAAAPYDPLVAAMRKRKAETFHARMAPRRLSMASSSAMRSSASRAIG